MQASFKCKTCFICIFYKGDYNVIVTDWRKGALEINYLRAVANARVVGAMAARLLKILRNEYGVDPRNVHIIGHSLGAHIAGYVGERTENIGRITGTENTKFSLSDLIQ